MKKHPIRRDLWTSAEIGRFWDYWSQRRDAHPNYFSFQVGRNVIRLSELLGAIRGKVLDYGCGPGLLLTYLLDKGYEASGFETSSESAVVCNERFSSCSNFHGVKAPDVARFNGERFDTIYCLEVLEHCDDGSAIRVLSDVRALLTDEGRAIFTVPNNEVLTENFIYCPFCNSEFHQVQHQRSLCKTALRQLLLDAGFELEFCEPINLNLLEVKKRVTDMTLYDVYGKAKGICYSIVRRSLRRKLPRAVQSVLDENGPHLIAIAKPLAARQQLRSSS